MSVRLSVCLSVTCVSVHIFLNLILAYFTMLKFHGFHGFYLGIVEFYVAIVEFYLGIMEFYLGIVEFLRAAEGGFNASLVEKFGEHGAIFTSKITELNEPPPP